MKLLDSYERIRNELTQLEAIVENLKGRLNHTLLYILEANKKENEVMSAMNILISLRNSSG